MNIGVFVEFLSPRASDSALKVQGLTYYLILMS